jgi:hypothetical protein
VTENQFVKKLETDAAYLAAVLAFDNKRAAAGVSYLPHSYSTHAPMAREVAAMQQLATERQELEIPNSVVTVWMEDGIRVQVWRQVGLKYNLFSI